MDIKITSGDITKLKADAIILPIVAELKKPEGDIVVAIDKAMGGAIALLLSEGEVKGKLNETTVIHTLGKMTATRVVLLGLGKPKELTLDKLRSAVAEACRLCQRRGFTTITIPVHKSPPLGITAEEAAQAITEGALLGTYTFRHHITKPSESKEIATLTLVCDNKADVAAVTDGYNKGKILAEATNGAREMVNQPGNFMTPTNMAETATAISKKYGLDITVMDEAQMKKLGMGALLGVAKGSQQPPKFIVMKYQGSKTKEVDIALVGKGLTFDTGGISLKPADKMEDMKSDMSGGAAVMNALGAIAQLKPKLNVVAIVPTTENMPGGNAQKPGDIVKAMNGKTIEVINTDAEGRLILADALSYAVTLKAKSIIDMATLTGACQIALGTIYSGGFTNNQELLDKVIAAGKQSGELIWQLPMDDKYSELFKSDVADMKNSGGRLAGAITGAKFLQEFVGDTPWVHLDIAGTALTDKESGYTVKGGTGVPVRTLINFVMAQDKGK